MRERVMNPNVRSAYVCDASSGYDFSNKFQQQYSSAKQSCMDGKIYQF